MIAAYMRVSSDIQAKAHGTDAQRAAIEGWLASQGLKGAQWFEDLAFSGKNTKRPAWSEMVGKVAKGDCIVVYSLSRAGRSLADLCGWVAEMVRREVRVVFIKEGIDIGTSHGRLLLHLLGSVAEYERELIAERASDGIRHRIAKGEKWGAARQFVNKRGTTEGCRKLTDAQWGEVRAKREAGATWAALAAEYRMHPNGVRYGLKRRANLSLGS